MALAVVETLYDTNLSDVPGMLRKLADAIEEGKYGEVSSCGVVLMGETMEVFGYGQDAEAPTIGALLQAGIIRLVSPIERYGRE